jgi:hypothetical protein
MINYSNIFNVFLSDLFSKECLLISQIEGPLLKKFFLLLKDFKSLIKEIKIWGG